MLDQVLLTTEPTKYYNRSGTVRKQTFFEVLLANPHARYVPLRWGSCGRQAHGHGRSYPCNRTATALQHHRHLHHHNHRQTHHRQCIDRAQTSEDAKTKALQRASAAPLSAPSASRSHNHASLHSRHLSYTTLAQKRQSIFLGGGSLGGVVCSVPVGGGDRAQV